MGGARERNAEKARCGIWESASLSGAASGMTATAKTTAGVPPTAFCIEAKETHSPHSWFCVGAACGSTLRCVLACTTMPNCANNSASDSTCTNQRRLRRIRTASAGEYSRKRRHRQAPLVASYSAVMQPLRLRSKQCTDAAASAAFSDVGVSPFNDCRASRRCRCRPPGSRDPRPCRPAARARHTTCNNRAWAARAPPMRLAASRAPRH